jgi:hypothetical protein
VHALTRLLEQDMLRPECATGHLYTAHSAFLWCRNEDAAKLLRKQRPDSPGQPRICNRRTIPPQG